MSSEDIDDHLESLDEPKRSTLTALRETIVGIVPDADQCISYGMPAFRLQGKAVAGFAAFKDHLSYLPHSGSVLVEVEEDLAPYEYTKGALRFPIDAPLPSALVNKLIAIRISQAFPH
jgi:uncharacterized protein YdhG (YjbR/CyaY superfamily)